MSDLKSFLLENLESSGALESIKNDLKSNLFNTLREEAPLKSSISLEGDPAESAAELVRDFFETFCMQYSLSVFLPESKLPDRPFQRELLEKKLSIAGVEDLPLLSTLISSLKKQENTLDFPSDSVTSSFNINSINDDLKKK